MCRHLLLNMRTSREQWLQNKKNIEKDPRQLAFVCPVLVPHIPKFDPPYIHKSVIYFQKLKMRVSLKTSCVVECSK